MVIVFAEEVVVIGAGVARSVSLRNLPMLCCLAIGIVQLIQNRNQLLVASNDETMDSLLM